MCCLQKKEKVLGNVHMDRRELTHSETNNIWAIFENLEYQERNMRTIYHWWSGINLVLSELKALRKDKTSTETK